MRPITMQGKKMHRWVVTYQLCFGQVLKKHGLAPEVTRQEKKKTQAKERPRASREGFLTRIQP